MGLNYCYKCYDYQLFLSHNKHCLSTPDTNQMHKCKVHYTIQNERDTLKHATKFQQFDYCDVPYTNGLVQDCSNSIALAVELLYSFTKLSMC